MNEQQLQCFACVAEYLNFTKAAEKLFLTVSTVTHHIQNLEKELNTKLLIRTTRSVRLTEAGESFYPDVREILARFEISKRRLQTADTSQITAFHIGCVSTTEYSHLRPVLTQMRVSFPQIHPVIIVDSYFNLKKQFENRQIELLLVTEDMANEIKGGTFLKLRGVKNYALIPKEAGYQDQTEFILDSNDDYCLISMHLRFIPFHDNNQLQLDLLAYAQNHDHIPCENEQTAVLLAQCGYGIAVLPDFLLPDNIGDLTILPINRAAYINYGFLYQSKEPHCKFFMEQYKKFWKPSSVLT